MVERRKSEETVCQGYAKGVFRVCFEMNNSLWDERIVGRNIFYASQSSLASWALE
jgi:hypothetical protein